MKQDDVKRLLQSSPGFVNALSKARSELEKKRLAKIGEDFVSKFADVLLPIIDRARNDPSFAQQLSRSLNERSGVLSSEPVASGSIG